MYNYVIQSEEFVKLSTILCLDKKFIPRIGDTIPEYYKPYPKVSTVILNIDTEESNILFNQLEKMTEIERIDAIIYVK